MSGIQLGILAGMWVAAIALFYVKLYRSGSIKSWPNAILVMLFIPALMVFSASDFFSFAPYKFIGQFFFFALTVFCASLGFQPAQPRKKKENRPG